MTGSTAPKGFISLRRRYDERPASFTMLKTNTSLRRGCSQSCPHARSDVRGGPGPGL